MANFWQIRDVAAETKRRIKVYAAQHKLTIAEALEQLSKIALEKSGKS